MPRKEQGYAPEHAEADGSRKKTLVYVAPTKNLLARCDKRNVEAAASCALGVRLSQPSLPLVGRIHAKHPQVNDLYQAELRGTKERVRLF